MSKTFDDIIPPRELHVAFLGTYFGATDHRDLLMASVLKKAMGYHCGYTITSIMEKMRLINKKGQVLSRGRELLRASEELHRFVLKSG